MKKLIAMLLCFALVAAMGASAAFASMPDPVSAYNAIASEDADDLGARAATAAAKTNAKNVKGLDRLAGYVSAYEAVKFNSSKTQDDVDAAQAALKTNLTALKEQYPELAAAYPDLFDETKVTSTDVGTAKTAEQVAEAANKLQAASKELEKNYWLTKGTKMDVNEWVIKTAKLEAADALASAQAGAAAAKAGAAKAQATAKALIADAVKVAQDAAATAVANAQASAYGSLASAYADAVESFWGEVELYMLSLG